MFTRRAATTLLILSLAGAALAAQARAADAQKLLRDYAFKKVFKDAAGGPDLKPVNGTLNDGNYTFAAGEGLELEKPGVKDEYAIELVFKLEDVEGWQKVIDFKNREADGGLYVYNGQLQFYDLAIGGNLVAGQEYTIRLERNSTNRLVTAFLNGAKVWEFADMNDDAVFGDSPAYFFLDDAQTMDEQSGGVITRLRIWDRPNAAAL